MQVDGVQPADEVPESDQDSPDAGKRSATAGWPDSVGGAAPSGLLERHYREQIPKLEESLKAAKEKARGSLNAIVILAVVGVASLAGAMSLRTTSGWWVVPLEWLLWGVTVFCGLFVLVGVAMFLGERRQQLEIAGDLANAEKWAGIVAPDDRYDYFDQLVAINLTNLSDYYSLVRSHAGRSFTLAATASILGFLLIAATLVFALTIECVFRPQLTTHIGPN